MHNKALQDRQCTRCLPCGFAVAQPYHKANTAYTAAERSVIRPFSFTDINWRHKEL